MAPDARPTTRATGGTLLEAATLLLAGLTALTVIARSDAESRHEAVGVRGAVPAVAARPSPPAGGAGIAPGIDPDEAERQAALRDMLLHD